METKAILKGVRLSAWARAAPVADLIRGQKIDHALNIPDFQP